jgi:linoleoyl-CoA desaturase
MATIKFNGNSSAFYTDLKARVENYFREQKIETHGNFKIYLKSAFYILSFIACYIVLVFFTPSPLLAVLLCVAFGLLTAGIGFNVMHDGGHGSYSPKKNINRIAAMSLNFLGGSSFLWNIKHNMIHHTFTNIDGHDDDILNEPFLRLTKTQKRRFYHRYQFIYWVIVYGFMYFGWVFILDIMKYFRKSIASKTQIRFDFKTHVGFWLTKIIYVGLFVVLPLQFMPWYEFLIGFGIWVYTTGLITSVVFQLAHAVEDTHFIEPNTEVLESDWAVHQVLTTANFGSRSKLLSFLTGGLNQQVEHHLFPRISHIHYPRLSPIVKATCQQHGLVYLEQPTFFHAVASHVRFLYKLGRRN